MTQWATPRGLTTDQRTQLITRLRATADGLDAVLTWLNSENKRLTSELAQAKATSAAPRLAQLATDIRAALTKAGL